MEPLRVTAVTFAERPDLRPAVNTLTNGGWPVFMQHDTISLKYWSEMCNEFAEYQTILVREDNEQVIAVANSIPVHYDGAIEDLPDAGWDWALESGCEQRKRGITPNLLSAIQIFVDPQYRGTGVSPIMLGLMKEPGRIAGFTQLVAPVRPPLKSLYPQAAMDEFITWTGRDGLSLDPWIRTHQKCGARIIKVCHKSFVVKTTISQWEEWTGHPFAGKDQVTIPEALVPVRVDNATKIATYTEPNVWMLHPIEPEPGS